MTTTARTAGTRRGRSEAPATPAAVPGPRPRQGRCASQQRSTAPSALRRRRPPRAQRPTRSGRRTRTPRPRRPAGRRRCGTRASVAAPDVAEEKCKGRGGERGEGGGRGGERGGWTPEGRIESQGEGEGGGGRGGRGGGGRGSSGVWGLGGWVGRWGSMGRGAWWWRLVGGRRGGEHVALGTEVWVGSATGTARPTTTAVRRRAAGRPKLALRLACLVVRPWEKMSERFSSDARGQRSGREPARRRPGRLSWPRSGARWPTCASCSGRSRTTLRPGRRATRSGGGSMRSARGRGCCGSTRWRGRSRRRSRCSTAAPRRARSGRRTSTSWPRCSTICRPSRGARSRRARPRGTLVRGARTRRGPGARCPSAVLVVGSEATAEALTEDSAARTRAFECERTEEAQTALDLARAYAPDHRSSSTPIWPAVGGASSKPCWTIRLPSRCRSSSWELRSRTPDEAARRFVALGVAKALTKPVSPDALRRACDEILDAREGRTMRVTLGEPTLEQLATRLSDEVKRALARQRGPTGAVVPGAARRGDRGARRALGRHRARAGNHQAEDRRRGALRW